MLKLPTQLGTAQFPGAECALAGLMKSAVLVASSQPLFGIHLLRTGMPKGSYNAKFYCASRCFSQFSSHLAKRLFRQPELFVPVGQQSLGSRRPIFKLDNNLINAWLVGQAQIERLKGDFYDSAMFSCR
jgi:hypothetical protein